MTVARSDWSLLLWEAARRGLSPLLVPSCSPPGTRVPLAAGSSAAAHALTQQPPVFCFADPLRSARLGVQIKRCPGWVAVGCRGAAPHAVESPALPGGPRAALGAMAVVPVPAATGADAFPAAASPGLPRERASGHQPMARDGHDVPEAGVGCGPAIDPPLPRAHFIPHLISLKAWCWLPALLRLLRHSHPPRQSPGRSRQQSWG